MKALITGANGMLGSDLCPELLKRNFKIIATDIVCPNDEIVYLDVRDQQAVNKAISDFGPDIVFHLAAATDVDKCEAEKEEAYLANAFGTENMVFACLKKDITLVYISTAAVFDGKKKEPYTEFDCPNPLNIYAQSKLEGERIVQRFLKKYFIIRAGWMIGGIDKDKKFVMKIISQTEVKNEILAVTDKIGSPTFTSDLSACLADLVKTERYGLYHMANRGSCSRYDIARLIVKFMGRDDIAVRPVTSNSFPLRAARPDSEAMFNFKLHLLGMNNIPAWEESLKKYILAVKANKTPAKSR